MVVVASSPLRGVTPTAVPGMAGNFSLLFAILVLIACINVLLVSVVWDQLLSKDNFSQQQASALRDDIGTSISEEFTPRKNFAAEYWTRDFVRCQVEDCNFVQSTCAARVAWSENDFRSCYSGLLVPKSAAQCTFASSPATCQLTAPAPLPAKCQKMDTNEPLRVYISGESEFVRDLPEILFSDESFTVGLGTRLVRAASAHDCDLHLLSQVDQRSRILESFNPETCQTTISLRDLGTRAKPQELYNALRTSVGELIQRRRAKLDSSQLSIAVFLVWSGNKPAPASLLRVADSFVRASPIFTVILLVDSPQDEYFAQNKQSEKIRVVHMTNLTRFIHTRAEELVPEIRGHVHYTLGWSLCDFRWLFGEIFAEYIPEEEFTHWAWADSDAYVSPDMFGALTDFGNDIMRHDVVSFAAIIYGNGNTAQSTMQAYVSGTLTLVTNTAHGRNLFRHTPMDRLIRGLVNPSNGILDEAITSNAVLSAPNVSVALIAAQCRTKGTVLDRKTNKIYYIVQNAADAAQLDKLRVLGRVGKEPLGTASVLDSQTRVLGRFIGTKPLPGQDLYMDRKESLVYPAWYTPPRVSPDSFLSLSGDGIGFATLLRSGETGEWYVRPLPHYVFHRTNQRQGENGIFLPDRALVRVEIAVVHSRIPGGPCEVHDASVFDWTNNNRSALTTNPFVDEHAVECKPFKSFFKK